MSRQTSTPLPLLEEEPRSRSAVQPDLARRALTPARSPPDTRPPRSASSASRPASAAAVSTPSAARRDSNPAVAPPLSSVALVPQRSPSAPPRPARRHSMDYPVDCGKRGFKHLSMAKVKYEMNKTHPRVKLHTSKGERYVRHMVCGSHAGRHYLCGTASPSDFAKYGLGVELYMKAVKFLGTLFLFLSIFAVPMIVFYHSGEAFETRAVTAVQKLSLLTLGNLGEGTTMCESGTLGDSLTLTCADGHLFGEIEAYYGNATGSCGCPSAQIPSPDCGGTPDGDACSPLNSYCHHAEERLVRLPSGDSFTTGECCAESLYRTKPDFRDLDIELDADCDSTTALSIVRGMCIGRSTCTLPVSSTTEFQWAPVPSLGVGCDDSKLIDGVCRDGFESSPVDLASCMSDDRRLIIVGTCYDLDVIVNGQTFSKRDIAIFVCYLDVAIAIVFLGCSLWLRLKEEAAKVRLGSSTSADYTIMVTNLPKHSNLDDLEQQLRTHFEELLGDAQPVAKQLPTINVADVNFGLTNARLISKLKTRGTQVRKLDIAMKKKQFEICLSAHDLGAALRQDQDHHASNAVEGRIEQLERSLIYIDRELDDILECDNLDTAVVAFVTFEETEGALRALDQYPNTWLYWLCQSRRKRLAGKRLSVERAPEASDIIWENLETGTCGRFMRSAVTFVTTLAFLGMSALLVYAAETAKRDLLTEFTQVDCDTLTDVQDKDLVIQDELPEFFGLETGKTGRLQCYCREVLFSGSPSRVLNEEFLNPETGQSEKWCRSWFNSWLQVQALTYGGAVSIVIANLLFRYLLKPLVGFEHGWSKTAEVLSRGTKLFILQFINTAALVLIINAQIDVNWDVLQEGEFRDFSQQWYFTVGVAITLTFAINIVTPHLGVMLKTALKLIKRCFDRGCTKDYSRTHKITQQQLESLYAGPDLLLDERYAQMLTTIFVSLMYSTGIPILLPIAFVFFVLLYWVDKWFFCRVYHTPPQYDSHLAERASSLLPYAVVVHLGIGMWMLGNDDIIPPNNALEQAALGQVSDADGTVNSILSWLDSLDGSNLGLSDRVRSSHVLPMFVVFTFLVAGLLISRLFWFNIKRVFRTCCKGCLERSHARTDSPNYFDGLPTEVLEAGIYDGNVKSSLMIKYMEAVQRRMRKKGWTASQVKAIHSAFLVEKQRESLQHRVSSFTTDKLDDVEAVAAAVVRRAASQRSTFTDSLPIIDSDTGSGTSEDDDPGQLVSPDAVVPDFTPDSGEEEEAAEGKDTNPEDGTTTLAESLSFYGSPKPRRRGRKDRRRRKTAAAYELPSPPQGSPPTKQLSPRHESALENREVFRRTMAATKAEQFAFINGLASYDLHANVRYRRVFALDAVVPAQFLRGLPGHDLGPAPDVDADARSDVSY